MSQIKLISEYYIKPETNPETTREPHHLSPVDLSFLTLDQMQRGLLFTNQPENMESFIQIFKESLSICLVDFYPLAGQFTTVKLHGENTCYVYVDCNKGRGARVLHATYMDVCVPDVYPSNDVPIIIQNLFDLGVKTVNYNGCLNPLLSIQVTELVDGVFIGFTMNHSIGDGTSLWHFISSLSEIFVKLLENQVNKDNNSIALTRKPIFRPYFPKGYGPIIKMPDFGVDDWVIIRENDKETLRVRFFRFSSESVGRIKAKASEESRVNNMISSFQALSAFMWRSITRARNLDNDLETCCALVMNGRSKFKPAISSDCFGNFITRDQTMCKVGQLLDNGLGWAAMLAHQLVASQDENKVSDFSEMLVQFLCRPQDDKGPRFHSPNVVLMGGSTRFDMYGPDFGLGKAKASLLGDCNREDGKITASPGREGDGSVDLEVCLNPKVMKALETDEEFMSFIALV